MGFILNWRAPVALKGSPHPQFSPGRRDGSVNPPTPAQHVQGPARPWIALAPVHSSPCSWVNRAGTWMSSIKARCSPVAALSWPILPSCGSIRFKPRQQFLARLLRSFLSFLLPLPLFFFFNSLFRTYHYRRNKKDGTITPLMRSSPSPAPLPLWCVPALFPPAQGWNRCQTTSANKQEEPDKPGTQ